MILWFSLAQIAALTILGIWALVLGLSARPAGDWILGGVALIFLVFMAQVVLAIVLPLTGTLPRGNYVEFWLYLASALILPIVGAALAIIERSRWSSLILALFLLALAVMVWRMQVIWS